MIPTKEQIDEALEGGREGAKTKGRVSEAEAFRRYLAAAYRAEKERADTLEATLKAEYPLRVMVAEARAELAERQYGELARAVKPDNFSMRDLSVILITQRHATERKAIQGEA
jgi:hypothetical protein